MLKKFPPYAGIEPAMPMDNAVPAPLPTELSGLVERKE